LSLLLLPRFPFLRDPVDVSLLHFAIPLLAT